MISISYNVIFANLYLAFAGDRNTCISLAHTRSIPEVKAIHLSSCFFLETQYKRKRSYTRAYTHPYERTHAHPTPMSTSGRLSRQIGSWDWRSHHGRLAIDGNVASHWKNIPPLWDTQMSNLGFELWWAGGTTTLLTTQPQVGSHLSSCFTHRTWVERLEMVENETHATGTCTTAIDLVRARAHSLFGHVLSVVAYGRFRCHVTHTRMRKNARFHSTL
jgi:hypothetical protein